MHSKLDSLSDSFRSQSAHSFLTADPLELPDVQEHILGISKTLAAFGQSLNAAIDQASERDCSHMDIDTIEMAPMGDSQHWLLESHLAPTE
jgi:hypothetical protein